MRMLLIHAERFSYRVLTEHGPLSPARDEVDQSTIENSYKDILICFTTVEEGDWERREEIFKGLEDLVSHSSKIGVEKILIYPYAHLSSRLEDPRKALRLIKILAKKLSGYGVEVYRAPFGWYKAFSLSTKGHPLAESYREL